LDDATMTDNVQDGRADDDPVRNETEAHRIDRNVSELLQELRIAGLGVQVLFGFLLAIPFSARFTRLSANQRHLYLASLLFAVLSIVLLAAPVAFHRIVFRRHKKAELLRAGNVMSLLGLGAVALSISGAVAFVVGFVVGGTVAVVVAALTLATFVSLWFLYPATRR